MHFSIKNAKQLLNSAMSCVHQCGAQKFLKKRLQIFLLPSLIYTKHAQMDTITCVTSLNLNCILRLKNNVYFKTKKKNSEQLIGSFHSNVLFYF